MPSVFGAAHDSGSRAPFRSVRGEFTVCDRPTAQIREWAASARAFDFSDSGIARLDSQLWQRHRENPSPRSQRVAAALGAGEVPEEALKPSVAFRCAGR